MGAAVGRTVKTSLNQTRVLVGAGTAAGFAAASNTPFAASLFVLETIAGIAAPELVLPVMAATVGATGIMRATVGAGPINGQRAFGLESYAELLIFGDDTRRPTNEGLARRVTSRGLRGPSQIGAVRPS